MSVKQERKNERRLPYRIGYKSNCFTEITSCELNIDSRCVELRYSNGSMIAIDAPLEYAELVLSGELEGYLKRVSSPYSGIGWDS